MNDTKDDLAAGLAESMLLTVVEGILEHVEFGGEDCGAEFALVYLPAKRAVTAVNLVTTIMDRARAIEALEVATLQLKSQR